jgi:hypothetical protein
MTRRSPPPPVLDWPVDPYEILRLVEEHGQVSVNVTAEQVAESTRLVEAKRREKRNAAAWRGRATRPQSPSDEA